MNDGDPEAGSPSKVARHGLQAKYDAVAPWYDLLDAVFEWGRYRKVRPRVFDPVRNVSRLLDCGVGTGRNVSYYPADVRVTAFDLSKGMLVRARRRIRRSGREVALLQSDVLSLPFAGDVFPAATATFLFCVLPDRLQRSALREIARVVRPGGRIVLLDYTLSSHPWRRMLMRLWAPWVRFAYGADFDRRTEEHAREAGLGVEEATYVHADILRRLVLQVPGRGELQEGGRPAGSGEER